MFDEVEKTVATTEEALESEVEEEVATIEPSAEETPVEETPVEESPVEEPPAEESPVDETTVDESAADEGTDDGGESSDTSKISLDEDGRSWYVVHCYSGYENKVRHSIEQRIETMDMQDKIFDVVVPTEEEIEIKDGKRRTVERRVFPGYILVQLIMDEDSWYVVRNTPGVTGFVGMGNEPTPLREDEVAKIMNRMEAEAPKVKFNFQPGEKVRIRNGPFADFIGTVDTIDIERAKVRVLVSFFGRETPVELDFLHVENI